jgi:hypothetical protein
MYIWDETEGEERFTCQGIVKHLKEQAQHHKHITIYSDSCSGQNRNMKMSLALMKLAQDPDIDIHN